MLHTLRKFASLYEKQGNYGEAETLYQWALASQQRQLGAEHPSTLKTVNGFANLRVRKILFNRALTGRVKAIGLRYLDTAETIENLARLYDKQGRLDEARMMRDKSLTKELVLEGGSLLELCE